ncbi:Tryptophan 5-hydroxylase 2, partial [Cichlidogyrus casuarinus]
MSTAEVKPFTALAPRKQESDLDLDKKSAFSLLIDPADVSSTLVELGTAIRKCGSEVAFTHLETRKSSTKASGLQLFVELQARDPTQVHELINDMNLNCKMPCVRMLGQQKISSLDNNCKTNSFELLNCPWFPTQIEHLDKVSNRVLMYGSELDADHPGFKDEEYRKRRLMFADVAFHYKHGQKIPRIEYTESEKQTWKAVYNGLTKMYPTHACKEHNENLPLLQKYAGYREDDLPQLEDVSNFLK